MKLFIVFAAVIVASNALSVHQHWANFKVKFNRSYENSAEEALRFKIFNDNVEKITKHNAKYAAGETTYTMGINQFADLTRGEFRARLGISSKNVPKIEAERHVFPENLQVADSLDWRQKGAVLDIKNQGQCGSCWAFSTTGALEGQNYILNKVKLSLSEQQLVDCSSKYGNEGCDGGFMDDAFEYVRDNGIQTEASYPYTGVGGSCRASNQKSVLKVSGYRDIAKSEVALKNAVGSVGPISIGVNADPLQLYSSGIIDDKSCDNNVDHGVLAVGYGAEGNVEYWIIKNSWGPSWGERGFYRLKRNANLCGITEMASYPVL